MPIPETGRSGHRSGFPVNDHQRSNPIRVHRLVTRCIRSWRTLGLSSSHLTRQAKPAILSWADKPTMTEGPCIDGEVGIAEGTAAAVPHYPGPRARALPHGCLRGIGHEPPSGKRRGAARDGPLPDRDRGLEASLQPGGGLDAGISDGQCRGFPAASSGALNRLAAPDGLRLLRGSPAKARSTASRSPRG